MIELEDGGNVREALTVPQQLEAVKTETAENPQL